MKFYKISQKKVAQEKKPYDILTLAHGVEKRVDEIWAYSSEQARALAINKHSKLRDYLEMGYEIVAHLNKEKWEQINKANKLEEKFKEEQIQNAWWQN